MTQGRPQKCTEKYLLYLYAKLCSNIMVTDDTGNDQNLKNACITSNSKFSYLIFHEKRKNKWIQLKSYCRYPFFL